MKSILLVGGGLLHVTTVQNARDMGLRVVVTDKSPDCACAKLADEFYAVDTRDKDGHVRLARSLLGGISPLAGVFTAGHSVEETTAAAANAVGLPAIPNEVAHRIANKAEMRKYLEQAGIDDIDWYCFLEYPDPAEIDFPCVVKATDSSGSRGLTKCYQPEDFTEEVFRRAQENSSDGRVLVEELLEPIENEIAEQSVETVWYEGKGFFLNWVDRPFTNDKKYAIEIGHYNPAMHSAKTQQEVERLVLAAGKALGMTTGIFKADVMLTKQGARILETTARLSGGFDSTHTSPLAHGVNYIRGAMKLALGEPIGWNDFLPRQYRHAVAISMFPEVGRIRGIQGLEKAREIVDHIFVRESGEIRDYTDCAARPLFIIASSDSRQHALDRAEMARQLIRFEYAN